MAVWYRGSDGTDHYGTPSNSSESASVSTSTQPTGSLSSGGGGSSSSGGSGSSSINTSGLSGYALAYANARNSGLSDTAAHAAATSATGNAGNGGTGTNFTAFDNGSGGNGNGTTNYNLDAMGNYAPAGKSIIQPDIIPAVTTQNTQQLLQQYLSMIPQAVNYQAQEYQQTIPNYSITSNPGNTSYIPTLKSKQLWNDQQQQNADNAYKGYTANMTNFAQAYQMLQDSITNAQKEKENEAKTIAERRAEATAAAEQKYKEGLLANDTAKTNYDISKPYSTGSSSGGLTPYQQYQIEQGTAKSEADSEAAMDKWVTNQVANDERLNSDYSNYYALYDAWKTMYVANHYGG